MILPIILFNTFMGIVLGIGFAQMDLDIITDNPKKVESNQRKFHIHSYLRRLVGSLAMASIVAISPTILSGNLVHFLIDSLMIFSAIHLSFDPALNKMRGKPFFYASEGSNFYDRITSKNPILWFIIEVLFFLITIWIRIIVT